MKPHYVSDEIEMPESSCPNCGEIMNAAQAVDAEGNEPGAGDASICMSCGHLSIFTDELMLRNPTSEELEKWAGDERLVDVMTALHRAKGNGGDNGA